MALSIGIGDTVNVTLPSGAFYSQVEVISSPSNNFPWWEFEEIEGDGEVWHIVCGSNLISIRKLIP